MPSPYRDLGKHGADAPSARSVGLGWVIVSLVGAWLAFVVHVVRAAQREELSSADTVLGFVLFGASVILVGAARGSERP